MNKLLTLAALSGVIAASACATTDGASGGAGSGIKIATGEQFTYTVTDTQNATFFGQSTKSEIVTTMGLNVLRGGADPLWRWTYSAFDIKKLELGEEMPESFKLEDFAAIMSPAVRLATAIGFECKPDLMGGCGELTNWSTWRGAIEDSIMLVEGAVKIGMAAQRSANEPMDFDGDGTPDFTPDPMSNPMAPDLDQRTLDMVVNITLNLLEGFDEKSAGALALSGLLGPPIIQGALSPVGASIDYIREIPLPYGGGNLVFNGIRTVESIDRANGTAVVVSSSELDGKAALTSILAIYDNLVNPNLQVFSSFDPENGVAGVMVAAMLRAQLETTFATSELTFKESTRGVVDLKTGMARDTRTEYTVSIKGGGDFDWLTGEVTGVQEVKVAAGAPQIARLTRREIGPPPPKPTPEPSVEEEMEPPAVVAPAPPPAKRQRPRPRSKR